MVDLYKSLYGLFSEFGPVLDIHIKRTMKMRGQAFVSFKDINDATRAMQRLQGSDLFGKPMVCGVFSTGESLLRFSGQEFFLCFVSFFFMWIQTFMSSISTFSLSLSFLFFFFIFRVWYSINILLYFYVCAFSRISHQHLRGVLFFFDISDPVLCLIVLCRAFRIQRKNLMLY